MKRSTSKSGLQKGPKNCEVKNLNHVRLYLAKHIISHLIWPGLQPRQKIVILSTFDLDTV